MAAPDASGNDEYGRTDGHPAEVERLEHVAGVDVAVVERRSVVDVGRPRQRRRDVDRAEQVAEVAGRREVLVLVGDPHLLDPARSGSRRSITARTSSSGADWPQR